MKKTQSYFEAALALFALLALPSVVYLAYVFPKTMALWADDERALSTIEQTLAKLSSFCQSFGLLLIPALLLTIIGCVFWAVFASKSSQQARIYAEKEALLCACAPAAYRSLWSRDKRVPGVPGSSECRHVLPGNGWRVSMWRLSFGARTHSPLA